MTDREACVAFNLTDRIGSATVEALAKEAGGIAAAWERDPNRPSRTGGAVNWEEQFAKAERYGVTILTPVDAEYPQRLLSVSGHPLVLYVKGDLKAFQRTGVALVGTRRATEYGRTIANHLAYDLAKAGLSIISGLALGIDAEAHRGALEADGVTIGVLGSGLDRFYPEENRELAREIVRKGGAVVSEFPFGRPADKTTFPIRNHVVAALAKGVVAVESPAKSGTLITTSIAAELGRAVMAIPSRIDSRMSAGCLQLIRDGAVLVRHADDVLAALGEMPRPEADAPGKEAEVEPPAPPYTVEEGLVMAHLDEQGISMDELARRTKLPINTIGATTMALRIKGFVKFLPGNRIALALSRM